MATAKLRMTAVPVTSKYGPRKGYTVPHKGVDTANGAAYEHSTFGDGVVTHAGRGTGDEAERGIWVGVEHAPGIATSYHSLGKLKVKEGDRVKLGDIVGTAGKSAPTAKGGPHVHSALWLGGKHVDPLKYLTPGKVVTVSYGATPAPAAPASGNPTIRKGSRGAAVGKWQRYLKNNYPLYAGKITVDESFGDQTDRLTREWQRRAGVVVDGVVGPQSWRRAGI